MKIVLAYCNALCLIRHRRSRYSLAFFTVAGRTHKSAALHGDQALEGLRKLRTEKAAEAKEMRATLAHLSTHRETAARLRADAEGGAARAAELSAQISGADQQLAALTQACVRSIAISNQTALEACMPCPVG
jgi:hypothetical protein